MPDRELFQLAASGSLRRAGILRAQVARMLRDPRSRALGENFAAQWLQTRKLKDTSPDPMLFPGFDDSLRSAMLEETSLFFETIQRRGSQCARVLGRRFHLRQRTAGAPLRHCGHRGRAVSPRCGGRHAAGRRAHSGERSGRDVEPHAHLSGEAGEVDTRQHLGHAPAPPPSGVEALKEGQGTLTAGTLRQRMEQHRSNPACASCHRRMDPLGFGLENFDAVGAWRTRDGGQSIDSSGKLPGGKNFEGPAGLKAALRSRPRAFARCLAEKMLTYALGRGLDGADRRALESIVDRLAADGYRFSALVFAIVESEPFRQPAQTGGQP